jgi:uncharacterized membrane protein YecN with MAPEG domain
MLQSVLIIALLGIIITLFSLNVTRVRAVTDIFLGDGGNESLASAIRAHYTILQFSLIFLVALTVYEMAGAPKEWIVPIGLVFILGRLMHAYGMLKLEPKNPMRAIGHRLPSSDAVGVRPYDLSFL